ncbi:MAG: hypothetical protein R3324_14400, partial [Halobacteriales archaeon]|nr:hypothetical protein [Halobacteriales archaeon]
PKTETRTVGGHEITYRDVDGHEEVRIDGRPMPFFQAENGYQLEANAYEPPQPTLLDAAEEYAKTIPTD